MKTAVNIFKMCPIDAFFAVNMSKSLVVIGAGAAGFFCAVNAAAANPALQVTILEKSSKLLSKVRVSGGGRCNVTHACFEIEELVKRYPRGKNFLKKAFHWFNTKDTIEWFEKRGVALKTESDGRMFPQTNTSQTIIDCLLKEANKYNVAIVLSADIVRIENKDAQFYLKTNDNRAFIADYLCVATGGYPKPGQFEWLRELGHTIEPPVPSLFTFNMPGNAITSLMGVSVENATVKIAGTRLQEQGPLLVTHWGMSGPVILRLSAWGARELAEKNYHFTIIVNWLQHYNEQSLRAQWPRLRERNASIKISARNPFALPNRLWELLLTQSGVDGGKRWSDVTAKEQNLLITALTASSFEVSGKTTFKDEFVTCGGIQLSETDPNTMQSRVVPRLFFAGEVMNVDGITGGFNFQHAWTSGWIAAKAIASFSAE